MVKLPVSAQPWTWTKYMNSTCVFQDKHECPQIALPFYWYVSQCQEVAKLIGPWKVLTTFYVSNFQVNFSDWWLRCMVRNCPQVIGTWPCWRYVNIGSGNGLVPSGNKPLPEPMLTQTFVQGSTFRELLWSSVLILVCCLLSMRPVPIRSHLIPLKIQVRWYRKVLLFHTQSGSSFLQP